MPAFGVLVVITLAPVGLGLWAGEKELLHRLFQGRLIALEGQDVVRSLLDHLLGDVPLTAHRVNGHNTPLQLQEGQ